MAAEFEWRFEDERPSGEPSAEGGAGRRRARWPVWLSVGLVVLAVVRLYAWWRVRREALVEVEAEVQAVAQLELHALAEGDTELYLSLQDNADPNWQEAQEARAALDALLPPPLPGLTATTALSVENARVVGDAARVEVVRMGGLAGGDMVPFRAVRFYRRSDDGRWLHTRADLDYAGHTVTFSGERVKIISFATDRDWIGPVAPELEGLAEQFCGLVSCQWHSPLTLDFTGTLDTVLEPEEVLPAPLLVGVPDDEAARAAWETGLRELLFDRLIAREAGRPSGSARGGELLQARLREWLRAKLELSESVSPNLDLVAEGLGAGEWVSLWSLWDFAPDDDDPRRPLAEAEIDLLLAFIEEEHDPSAVAGLLHTPREYATMWMLVGEELGEEDRRAFERRYLAYVRETIIEFFGEAAAFAEYDLVVACGEPWNLWGLRLDRPEMTVLSSTTGLAPLSWSPDGAQLLVWWDMIENGMHIYLLEADGSVAYSLPGIPEGAELTGLSPDGSCVAYSMLGPSLGGGVVNVETGEGVTLDGQFLAWSPDGSYLTYATYGGPVPLIWLVEEDGSNPRQVGEGYSIAWSPDVTQIASFNTGPTLEVYDVTTEETRTVLDGPTLYGLLGLSPESENVLVQAHSLAWSSTGEWIGFGVDQFEETEATGGMEFVRGSVVLVHPDGSGPRVPFTCESNVYVTGWSPDGRWLTSYTYDGDRFTTTVIGIDGTVLLETNAWVTWSPDGRYLAVTEEDRLRILEVESGAWYSFEPAARCGPVVWNPRGPLHEPIPSARLMMMPQMDWRFTVEQCDMPKCQH